MGAAMKVHWGLSETQTIPTFPTSMDIGKSHFPCFRIVICKFVVINKKMFVQHPLFDIQLFVLGNERIVFSNYVYNGVQTEQGKKLGE